MEMDLDICRLLNYQRVFTVLGLPRVVFLYLDTLDEYTTFPTRARVLVLASSNSSASIRQMASLLIIFLGVDPLKWR